MASRCGAGRIEHIEGEQSHKGQRNWAGYVHVNGGEFQCIVASLDHKLLTNIMKRQIDGQGGGEPSSVRGLQRGERGGGGGGGGGVGTAPGGCRNVSGKCQKRSARVERSPAGAAAALFASTAAPISTAALGLSSAPVDAQ
ncbi:Protein of unknown function [Gryllus bimaculatus]|nr:Protein of unknown function [Gryllus bimaculatus]